VAAAIDGVDVNLELSQLEAPYDGGITARLEDEGTVVVPGQPILRLIELAQMEVRIGIPPDTAADLLPGQRYAVEIAGKSQDLVLATILNTIDPTTRTRTAIFAHGEATDGAQNNALAHLVVERPLRAPGFWLPITALTEGRRGLWSAFVVVSAENDDGGSAGEKNGLMRVERRQLQVIHTDADRAYVRGTIRDGELVITTGVHRLVPDQLVRVGP
jgi:multidrug efflux pump subunit AcrA (membrane-fusion protein)